MAHPDAIYSAFAALFAALDGKPVAPALAQLKHCDPTLARRAQALIAWLREATAGEIDSWLARQARVIAPWDQDLALATISRMLLPERRGAMLNELGLSEAPIQDYQEERKAA